MVEWHVKSAGQDKPKDPAAKLFQPAIALYVSFDPPWYPEQRTAAPLA